MKIILASTSPRRKQLLSWLVKDFEVVPSNINEEAFLKLARTPEELVVKLAQAKVKDVAKKTSKPAVIIAGDLIVVLGEDGKWQALNKPKNEKQAEQMLRKLRGREHKIFTGICIMDTRTKHLMTDFAVSKITFKNFSDRLIKEYIATGKPMDKAGAYGIQEIGKEFVEKIEGSFTNIVGLPLKKLSQMLKSFKIPVKDNWQEKVRKETGYEF